VTAIAAMPSKSSVNPWLPKVVTIGGIQPEVPGIATYQLNFANGHAAAPFSFRPGQFNMVYLPGIGEVPISISSDPTGAGPILHTIREAGSVTSALARKQVGETLGLRGPFGSSWPTDKCKAQDIVIACGGVGLAPLRPAIYEIVHNRKDYGRVFLLYGARTPGDLLFTREYDTWRNADIEIFITVDIGDARWRGNIGVVPTLFYRLRLEAKRTHVMTCGPEIMISFVVFEALARRIPRDHIHVSMERNMNCAIGQCGHCQFGPKFVCKDGPVFTYKELAPLMHTTEDL